MIKQTAGRDSLGEFAPEFAHLNDDGLFGVKRWHGAAKDSWFSHVAFEAPGEGCSNEWCEPVGDEEYSALN